MTKTRRTAKKASLSSVLILCIVLSGCSVFQVHKPWPRLAKSSAPPTLREAVQLTHDAEDELMRKIGDQTLFRNSIALAEILLAGSLGAAALTGASSDLLIAGSVAGVTGLGVAAWFESKPRQRVYLLGIKALICSVEAVTALQGVGSLDDKLFTLNSAISNAEANIANVSQKLALLRTVQSDNHYTTAIDHHLTGSRADVETAKKVFDSGKVLQIRLDEAGAKVENSVDRIMSLVTEGVLLTESELSELRGLIGDLVFTAPNFIRLPDVSAFPKVPAKLEPGIESDADEVQGLLEEMVPNLDQNLQDLNLAVAKVNAAAREIEAVVRSTDAANSIEKLKKCGVDISAAVQPLTTDLGAPIEFTEGQTDSSAFSVQGGNGKYSGTYDGAHDGLSFDQAAPFAADFVIKATEKAKADRYRFTVTDITGAKIRIPIVVKKPPANQNKKDEGDIQVRDMQELLKEYGFGPESIDGTRGAATNAAIQTFLNIIQLEKTAGDISTTKFTDLFVVIVTGLDESLKSAAGNWKTGHIRDITIEKLLKAKGHDPGKRDGKLDLDTKAAVAAFNNGTELRIVTDQERDAILKKLRDAGALLDEEKDLN